MAAKTISKLTILIGARSDKLRKDLQQTNRSVRNFEKGIDRTQPKLNNWAGAARRAAAGVLAIAGAVGAFSLVKLAADAETAQVAFSVLLKDGAAAAQLLKDIREFAGSTPLQQGDIIDSSRMLLAFGESVDEVLPTLRRLGDVGSLTGNRLQDLAEIYGKARVQGTLFAEDINQLTGRGIPVIQEFAKQLGVSTGEVKKLASEGKISFENLRQAFIDLTSTGGTFAEGMAKQSETLAGKWSTLKDQAAELARMIGTALLPAMKGLVESAGKGLKAVQGLSLGFVKNVVQIAAFVTAVAVMLAVVPKIVRAIRAIIIALKSQTVAQIIANSTTLAGAAMTAAALGIGAIAANRAGRSFDKLTEGLKKTAGEAAKTAQGVKKVTTTVEETTKATEDSTKAVDDAMKKWQQLGDTLTERFRTPFEKLRDSLAEARTALELGTISLETFERASGAAFKEFETNELKREEIQARPMGAGAVTAGSQAAYDAIARQASRMTANREQQNQDKRLADRRDQLLQRLNDETEGVAEAVRANRLKITEARI